MGDVGRRMEDGEGKDNARERAEGGWRKMYGREMG